MNYEQAKKMLQTALRCARTPHALLLSDASGAECSLWSYAAKLLLCEGETKPCGACVACARFEAGNHADYLLLYDEKGVKIDRVRELMDALSQRPLSGRRVIVVRRADLMTPQAQNALLKSIEEPSPNTYFILTAKGSMLPTLRSRAMELRCGSLSEEEMVTELMKLGGGQAAASLCARVAQGDMERAKALLFGEDAQREREAALELVPSVAEGKTFTLDKTLNLNDALSVWETFFRDSIVIEYLGEECAINADRIGLARNIANNFTIARRQGIMDTIYKAKRRLKSNANPQMTLDFMAAEISGLNENRG